MWMVILVARSLILILGVGMLFLLSVKLVHRICVEGRVGFDWGLSLRFVFDMIS